MWFRGWWKKRGKWTRLAVVSVSGMLQLRWAMGSGSGPKGGLLSARRGDIVMEGFVMLSETWGCVRVGFGVW